jgi:pyrimidine operon attenuation protein/uracil phosphoribosyltransferase
MSTPERSDLGPARSGGPNGTTDREGAGSSASTGVGRSAPALDPTEPPGRDSARAAIGDRIVLDPAGVQRVTTRMAHEIRERNADLDQVELVGIAQGGLPVARMVAQRLGELSGREISIGELDVTLYRDDVLGRGKRPVPRRTRMPHSVAGKRIVLIDDVIFTGRTIRAAMDAVIDFGRPQAIQVACLIDRGHREFPIQVDFVGKNIPTARAEEVTLRMRADGEYEVSVR